MALRKCWLQFFYLFNFLKFYLFIYFWLCMDFSLVVASRVCSLVVMYRPLTAMASLEACALGCVGFSGCGSGL